MRHPIENIATCTKKTPPKAMPALKLIGVQSLCFAYFLSEMIAFQCFQKSFKYPSD
jgi:hypothetical protein